MRNQTSARISAAPATPPTTPPAMAPVFVDEEDSSVGRSVAVAAGESVCDEVEVVGEGVVDEEDESVSVSFPGARIMLVDLDLHLTKPLPQNLGRINTPYETGTRTSV
jgi:hypothetical protein